MKNQYFHFTLGPVQGFVAQARRTRDFWAGSFLLSYLSAVAITAVKEQGGELLFPTVEKDYLAWLKGDGKANPPQQGCIPNRFKGGLAKVSGDFNPQEIEQSIQAAWKGLADAVWEKDLKGCGKASKDIWDRQVNDFWEISWVLTDSEDRSDLLDRRKNWRAYLPPEEGGVKCMMMDGWQELSAVERPKKQDLDAFWKPLRNQSSSLKNDLREDEYLCAIAFIKRRFSHVFKGFRKDMPGGWVAHGWRVNSSVPSVSYMAAAPWLAQVIKTAPEQAISKFLHSAKKISADYGKTTTEIACLTHAITERGSTDDLEALIRLEGDVYFESLVDNKINDQKQGQQEQAKQVKKHLQALVKDLKLEPVSPFYAVLMMDGDSLGVQMSEQKKPKPISESLNLFTKGVAEIVEKNSGFLIYAGGDDVLALLPLEHALNCAKSLRQHYLDCFEEKGKYEGGHVRSTLSGAIEYAHIKMPLGKVLADAHHLLDEVAKDEYGRDSIAVRVWKPGGQHLQWAMPWELALRDGVVVLDDLAEQFRATEKETPFSSSFFFNIEARFAMLQSKQGGEWQLAEGFSAEDIKTLIAVEYLNSGVNKNRKPKLTLADAKQQIDPLIEQCLPQKRNAESDKFDSMNWLNADGAHLVRFLATKGVAHG